ncbi:hypothetical protein ACO0OE_000717 [Hanseniaspora uvarum]
MTAENFKDILDSKNVYESINTLPSSIKLEDVEEFLNIKTWSHNKTFKNNYKSLQTDTYSKYNNEDYWCMRYTKIDGVDEKTFREQYNADFRVLTEKKYIHAIVDTKVMEKAVRSDNAVVQFKSSYKLVPFLFDIRHFYQWVYISKPVKVKNTEISYVVSLRSKPDQKQNTKCYYVSVEMLKYNNDSKELEWYMATTSDAGGMIPLFVQKLGIDKAVVEDIPSFLKYINY